MNVSAFPWQGLACATPSTTTGFGGHDCWPVTVHADRVAIDTSERMDGRVRETPWPQGLGDRSAQGRQRRPFPISARARLSAPGAEPRPPSARRGPLPPTSRHPGRPGDRRSAPPSVAASVPPRAGESPPPADPPTRPRPRLQGAAAAPGWVTVLHRPGSPGHPLSADHPQDGEPRLTEPSPLSLPPERLRPSIPLIPRSANHIRHTT